MDLQFDHDDHMILLLGCKENFVSGLLSVVEGLVGGFISGSDFWQQSSVLPKVSCRQHCRLSIC